MKIKKEDTKVGILAGHIEEGGSRYNVLNSCIKSLIKAFNNTGVKAYSVQECIKKNITPNFTLGLNGSEYELWGHLLAAKIPVIMWNVDSIFYQNMEALEEYAQDPNFALLTITPSDQEALSKYYPSLKHRYMPGAIDLDFWKKEDCEKEFDLVYFSSIFDYEEKLLELKNRVEPDFFNLMMEIYEIALAYPKISFWEVIQMIKEYDFNKYGYGAVFHNLIYIIDYVRRIRLVQSLSQFNLKLYGSPVWQKYISGNIEYLGEVNYYESVHIMNRSKLVLHHQPKQIGLGLNERILNASAIETCTIASDIKTYEDLFGDSLVYYNSDTFEDIAEKVNYFLIHDDERIYKAKNARKIVEENHTMTHRANQILQLLGIE